MVVLLVLFAAVRSVPLSESELAFAFVSRFVSPLVFVFGLVQQQQRRQRLFPVVSAPSTRVRAATSFSPFSVDLLLPLLMLVLMLLMLVLTLMLERQKQTEEKTKAKPQRCEQRPRKGKRETREKQAQERQWRLWVWWQG